MNLKGRLSTTDSAITRVRSSVRETDLLGRHCFVTSSFRLVGVSETLKSRVATNQTCLSPGCFLPYARSSKYARYLSPEFCTVDDVASSHLGFCIHSQDVARPRVKLVLTLEGKPLNSGAQIRRLHRLKTSWPRGR